ncbi:unnamed protein product [Ilex paraguariensis]|uniref:C2H2-type domain-containing protein n=1 Tax=Ilex paraguariensis TaxID=185542 RepID=A0ABC8SSH5_9AQUA
MVTLALGLSDYPTLIICPLCSNIFFNSANYLHHFTCHFGHRETPLFGTPFRPILPFPAPQPLLPLTLQNNQRILRRPPPRRYFRRHALPTFTQRSLAFPFSLRNSMHGVDSTPASQTLPPGPSNVHGAYQTPMQNLIQYGLRAESRQEMNEPPADPTRGYLDQLDLPVPEMVELNESDGDVIELDLNLRL